MNERLSDEELDALQRELESRRATAEQEIVEVEEMKAAVESRQGIIASLSSKLSVRWSENHFARDYEITMRTKQA